MAAQLCTVVFHSGRDAAASASERARQSVNRALKMVEERIAEHDRALGAIFSRSRREPLAPLTPPPTAPADPCESGPHSFVQSVFTLDPVNTPTQENGAPPWSTNRAVASGTRQLHITQRYS